MMIKKTTIQIGLEKPLKILHITDSHLPFYCETDSEAMINQGKKVILNGVLAFLEKIMNC